MQIKDQALELLDPAVDNSGPLLQAVAQNEG